MPHDVTARYRFSLLELLHKGQPIAFGAPEVQALLPDLSLPDTLQAEKAAYVRHTLEVSHAALQGNFSNIESRLAAIEAINRQMAQEPKLIPLGDGGDHMLVFPNGNIKTVRIME